MAGTLFQVLINGQPEQGGRWPGHRSAEQAIIRARELSSDHPAVTVVDQATGVVLFAAEAEQRQWQP